MGFQTSPVDLRRQSQLLVGAMGLGLGWTLLSLAGLGATDLARLSVDAVASARDWVDGLSAIGGQVAGQGGAPVVLAAWAAAIGGLLRAGRRRLGQRGAVAMGLPVAVGCRVQTAGPYAMDLTCLEGGPVVPVLAPAAGRVVSVHGRRGSELVLQLQGGGFAVIGRLQAGSILVRVGEEVAAGAELAACGGSLRLGARGRAGGGGVAIRLAGFVTHGNGGPQWRAAGVPETGAVVQRAEPVAELGFARGEARFLVEQAGVSDREAVLRVDGTGVSDGQGGKPHGA